VLGSGVYRIGSSVEFDYSAVQCIRTLRDLGEKTVMINYNPETVSTDYDESDRLYFEELSLERVLDINDKENTDGHVVSVGGQIPNTLCLPLHKQGVHIVGTHPTMVDNAEDRHKFSSLMDEIGVGQPAWAELSDLSAAREFCQSVGYPVIVRPSYVLSGAAMNVVHDEANLDGYLADAAAVSKEHPVVVSKFIENAREIDFDGIALNGEVMVHAIADHVEQAGVHSGDACLVLPAHDIEMEVENAILDAADKIAKGLNISGPFNMQFIVDGTGDLKVIECNLRASRSLPFVSKVVGHNFIEMATRIFLNLPVEKVTTNNRDLPYVGVKTPQFSFRRLIGADPVLGVEMASTGEVACFGKDKYEAFLKSMLSSNIVMPTKTVLLMTGDHKDDFVASAQSLVDMGFEIVATPETADHLKANGIAVTRKEMPSDTGADGDDVISVLQGEEVDMVLAFPRAQNLSTDPAAEELSYRIRRTAVDHNTPIITNKEVATMLVESLANVQHMSSKSYQQHRREAMGLMDDPAEVMA